MSVIVQGEEKRIGIALSGGGFRAAAFHLGVFRELKSLGLLWKLDVLSCVSGGSIAGAFLALNWKKEDALDRLDDYLKRRSIAVASVLRGLLNPRASRLDELANSYDRHLFDGAKLKHLKGGPRIYLNATNVATGNMFFFVAGENKPTEMGEWELGQELADEFSLSRAVAASSAFPPVFPPLVVDESEYPTADVDYVALTDGGIYDNLGVNPLFRKRNDLAYAIASDAGKPFQIEDEPTTLGAGVLKESVGILMEQVRGLQFERLKLTYDAKLAPKPLWFSIDSEKGEVHAGDAEFASSIGTNLKRLSDREREVLARHAGALLKHRIDEYAPELRGAP